MARWIPWLAGLAVLLLNLPLLATTPQNPDGAEMVAAALHGGVLHAPGYPLQVWLNRLFVQLPFGTPAFRLALLSALSAAGVAVLLLKSFEKLKLALPAALLGAGLFLFFPITWYLSVQPEKYLVASFWVALLIHQTLTRKNPIIASILFALALLQHQSALIFFPFVLASLTKDRRSVYACIAFIGTYAATYATLFLATSPTAWPDWGKIQSLGDLASLVLSSDFSAFRPKADLARGSEFTAAWSVFARQYWESFAWAIAFPLAGVIALWKKRSDRTLWPFAGALLIAAIYLFLARFESAESAVSLSYVERYGIPVSLLLGFFAAFGYQELSILLPIHFKRAAPVVAGVLLTAFFAKNRAFANASQDHTIELFRRGLAVSEIRDAYYLAGTDLELFFGYESQGKTRYPLFGDYPWSHRVLHALDTRIRSDLEPLQVTVQLAQMIYRDGGTVMISNPRILNGAPETPFRLGIFWFLGKNLNAPSRDQALATQARLCELLAGQNRPHPAHHYSRYLLSFFPTCDESL